MFKLPTLLIATTIAGTSLMNPNLSVSLSTYQQKQNSTSVIIKELSSNSTLDFEALCNKLGVTILSGTKFPNCPNLNRPNINCPELDKPDTDNPDNKPDSDKPENNIPDNKPDADKPENNIPDNKPDTDTPSTETPDNNQSYAKQVVSLVNAERKKAGLSPLTMKENISAAALVRAKETKTSFSHTRPNGSSFSTALTEQGVKFKGSGENIAWGQKTPKQVMNAWMNSSGHRANILNKNYTSIGVGYYVDSSGTPYWTQLFTY